MLAMVALTGAECRRFAISLASCDALRQLLQAAREMAGASETEAQVGR